MAELSSRSGVAASTIRYYLRLGLLPEPLRTASTMAYYGPEHLERLNYIRRRVRAGATLRQLQLELADQADASAAEEDPAVHSSQRARLISAGSAVFLRSGFEGVSVDDIVGRAGVGKAAFYRHFAGKRELLAACLDTELDWYEAATSREEPSADRLIRHPDLLRHRRLRVLISLFALLRQADAGRAINRGEALEAARARLRAPLEADLRAAREAGRAFASDDRLAAEMLLSVAEYTLAYAARSGSGDAPSLVRQGWNLVLTGQIHG